MSENTALTVLFHTIREEYGSVDVWEPLIRSALDAPSNMDSMVNELLPELLRMEAEFDGQDH